MGGRFGKGRGHGHGPKFKGAIERLDRCHRRLEERFELLEGFATQIAGGSVSTGTWVELGQVFAEIERTVERHDADEEESIFPRLAEHPALRPLLDRLRGDHQSQTKQIQSARVLLDRLEQAGGDALARRFLRLVQQLRAAYEDHIRREDRELLPAVERYISVDEQDVIAHEMMQRRGPGRS